MVTKKIADFVIETGYDRIPKEAVETAKLAILDMLGAALAGTEEPAVEILTDYVKSMSAKEEATVIAGNFKTSMPLAALINGTSGHALDYDDASYSTLGHPTVALLPAVMAIGEKNRLSGKAALAAYVLGFEVMAKIAFGLGFDVYQNGWHCTSTIGVMGAAAAGARLLKLSPAEVQTALGLAGSLSGGLRQNFGTMTKPLHAGVAAHNGVMASLLAGRGYTSDNSILESPMGYAKVFSPNSDPIRMSQDLGAPFDIVTNGLAFKPYPSCRFTHHLIDAVLHLVNMHAVDADDVLAMDCRIFPVVTQVLIHHRPKTALEGKFSLEYCVARALLDRNVRLDHFTDKALSDHKVQDLMSRVRYHHVNDDTNEKLGEGGAMPPAGVKLILRDGTELSHTVKVPKGDPGNPMTADELIAKFRDCAARSLSPQKIDRCVEVLLHLELLEDISSFTDVIA